MNKTQRTLVATLALTPFLFAFEPRGTKVAFSVEEGATKTKTFSNVADLTLDDMSILMNGQESPMTPEMDMNVKTTATVTVTDEYLSMRDGAPAKLVRTYDTVEQNTSMAMEMDMMGQVQSSDMDIPAESELEGQEVVFKWNSETDAYDVSFKEEEGDEELLKGLSEDMDLRGFLPEDEVAEGDEWEIDPVVVASVLAPGGDLKLISEGGGGEMMGMDSEMGSFEEWFSEDIEGEVKATFSGIREADDGTEVGVIKITIEITNAVDLTEMMQEGLDNADLPEEMGEMDMEFNNMDIELELEAEATLLWNLAGGCAHSFEMSGDFAMQVDIGMSISAQGMDMEIEQALELSGSMNSTATVE